MLQLSNRHVILQMSYSLSILSEYGKIHGTYMSIDLKTSSIQIMGVIIP